MQARLSRFQSRRLVWVASIAVATVVAVLASALVTTADARLIMETARGAVIGAGIGALVDGEEGARTGAVVGAVMGAAR